MWISDKPQIVIFSMGHTVFTFYCNKWPQTVWHKTVEFILSQLWRPEVWNLYYWAEIKGLTELHPLWKLRGEALACLFQPLMAAVILGLWLYHSNLCLQSTSSLPSVFSSGCLLWRILGTENPGWSYLQICLSLFSVTITEYQRMGNLSRWEVLFSSRFWRSEEPRAFDEGLVLHANMAEGITWGDGANEPAQVSLPLLWSHYSHHGGLI